MDLLLWMNGRFVGYSEDSFTPSEFELTEYVKDGENKRLQVFKKSGHQEVGVKTKIFSDFPGFLETYIFIQYRKFTFTIYRYRQPQMRHCNRQN